MPFDAHSWPQRPPGSSCSQSISRDDSNSTGTVGLHTSYGSSPSASRWRSAFFVAWFQLCLCWKQPGTSKTSCAYIARRNARSKTGTVKPMSAAVFCSSSGSPNQRGLDEASRVSRAMIRSAAPETVEVMAALFLSSASARASVGCEWAPCVLSARSWLGPVREFVSSPHVVLGAESSPCRLGYGYDGPSLSIPTRDLSLGPWYWVTACGPEELGVTHF